MSIKRGFMENLYQEIDEFLYLNQYMMMKDKEQNKEKCKNYINILSNESLSERYFRLNILYLSLLYESEFDDQLTVCRLINVNINDKQMNAFFDFSLANIYRNRFFNNEALQLYQEAYAQYKLLNNEEMMAKVNLNLAILYCRTDKYIDAYKLMIDLIDHPAYKNDKNFNMSLYSWLTVVENQFNNYDKSVEYCINAANLAFQLKNMSAYAVSQNSLGLCYYYMGKFDLALESFLPAQKIALEYANYDLLADVLHNIGLVYSRMSDTENALLFYLQSLEYRKKTSNYQNLAITLSNIGSNYVELKNFSKAKDYLEQSLNIREKYDLKSQLIISYFDLANLYLNTNELQIAEKYINKALDSKDLFNHDQMKVAYDLLEHIALKNEDYEQALSFAKKKNNELKKLINYESNQKAITIKNKFDIEIINKEAQEMIATEKKKMALDLAHKTKDKIQNPLNKIKHEMKTIKKQIDDKEAQEKLSIYLKKIDLAIDRIDEILQMFENNNNISFKDYMDIREMVEFNK